MSVIEEERKAIRILSFDSGGPGTYSQLLILKEYVSLLANDLGVDQEDVYPADHFELMGGTGFGGLVAIMLGHLRMNIDEAIDALIAIATAIFPEGSQEIQDPEKNLKNLKEAVEDLLQTRGVPVNIKMHERAGLRSRCKVALYAATSDDINHPQVFRTYSIRGSSLNATIVEAICATMAVPSYFSPVKIGRIQRRFVGSPLGSNNPTRELLKEAGVVFGNEKRVAQIVSIGCGIPPALSVEAMANENGTSQLLKEMIPAECQMVAKELAARLFNVDVYLRLSVEKGIGAIGIGQWNMLGDIETHTACYVETQVVAQALEASLKRLQRRDGPITLGHLTQSSTIRVAAKKAPSVSPYFVLREKEWETLVWHLVTSPPSLQQILPITGMGGCGKTQLVSYFLQEYPSLFTHVVFVDASTLLNIENDLQTWARTLGDGHERDAWEDGVRILASTPEDERWALILDSADDPTLNLSPVLPKNKNLAILITSRNRNLGNLSTTYHIELGEMETEEALATLLRAARRQLPLSAEEMKSAHTLLQELGCLAVALVQAGTYCHELSYTFNRYLALFYAHRAELMKKAEPSSLDNYRRGAYTTLDLSYKALPQPSREFLHFICFFHHTDIPLAALETAAKSNFDDPLGCPTRPEGHSSILTDLKALLCDNGNWSEMHVQEILRTLRSFSLVSITSVDDQVFLQFHPLVQSWSRDMDPSNSQHHRAKVVQVLTTCSSEDAFLLSRHILPHFLNIIDQIQCENMHVNDLLAAGRIFNREGHYQAARVLFGTALKILKEAAQNEEEMVALVSEELALAYNGEGKWNEAEKLEVEVLELRRRILGTEHPDVIAAAANLAAIYSQQGRTSEAEKLKVEILEQRKRTQGIEHPNTILAAANLAVTYLDQGRTTEAERLQVEVLGQRRRLLGMEHPHTILAAANLATTYAAQGRTSEAVKLHEEVLEQRKRIFGMEHPDTILAAANLAATYLDQGRASEAEKLLMEVLEQRQRILGKDHPHTILSATNLATTYSAQGRTSEAEKLLVEVLEQWQRILGKDHPHTIISAANLASAYSAQGRTSEAEKLLMEVLEQRQRILGKDHPHTIISAANLATTYSAQGRTSEAEKLLVEVLEQRQRILGKDHPHTIMSAANLATTYFTQGRTSEAEKLEVEVLEQRKRVLGIEDPHTILAAANLAMTYRQLNRLEESASLLSVAVELSLKVLGHQHPNTQSRIHCLVRLYDDLGKEREAQETRNLLIS